MDAIPNAPHSKLVDKFFMTPDRESGQVISQENPFAYMVKLSTGMYRLVEFKEIYTWMISDSPITEEDRIDRIITRHDYAKIDEIFPVKRTANRWRPSEDLG